MFFPYSAGETWISLAVVAAATKKLKLCTGISPLPRYSHHLLARLLTGLDLLSQGRIIFGSGLGVPSDFISFGKSGNDKTRAEMTEEAWIFWLLFFWESNSSMRENYIPQMMCVLFPHRCKSREYRSGSVETARPQCFGLARWDGWIIGTIDERQKVTNTPRMIAEKLAYILENRSS
jgi:hypothetical protein